MKTEPTAPPFHQRLPEPEATLSPMLLLRAVRKHWLLVAAILALSVGGAALFTSNQKRIYEAVATVQFDPQPLMPLGRSIPTVIESGPEGYWSNLEYFATQHQVITSRKVASLVVNKLGLNHDGAFINNLPTGTASPSIKLSVEDAAEILRGRLKVKPIEESRLAVVRYQDADPVRAQRLLAAVVDAYVDQNLDASLDSTNKTSEWLSTQLMKLKGDLDHQEMELHDFKTQYNLLSVSYDDQTNLLRAEIQQLNSTLTTLKAKRESMAARLHILEGVNPEDPNNIPVSELLGGAFAELRGRYINASQQHARLLALGKGDSHPELRAAHSDFLNSRQALHQELKNLKEGVAADFAAVNRELEGVSGLYERAKHQALELNLNELMFNRLRRSKDNTERLFGLLLERSTESGLSKMMPFNNVRVLDRPLKPVAPVFPKTSANLALGAVLGLLLGLAVATARELMDRTVRTQEDIERELGITTLGQLPDMLNHSGRSLRYYYNYSRSENRKRKPNNPDGSPIRPELLVHTHPKSAVAESARAIRTNLMFMSPDQPYKSLVVTSAGPAEGKTTVASSVALAMAQAGQKVCLLDCDLRRPRVHTLFGRANTHGVTTALLNPNELDFAALETDIPNLSVLQAGPTPPNPADLMHTERFAKLLENLTQHFDRIVIDSPPVGLVTDGVILATRADATLLVVRAFKTRRDAARRAIRALRDVGANCAGFVLNAAVTADRYDYAVYYAAYGSQPESQPTG